ncbi:MAG TPA: toprim domain-containing protein [Candidatus Thermoplasmatota archaeon]|nr:toprim domain-containing protein [Candidatus Thermoplasmatota archaeon]
MGERERFETLLEVLEELREVNRYVPILVEGARDVASLRALGFTGTVLTVHTGRPLYETYEALAREHPLVIILTDWDRKGTRLLEEAERAIGGSAGRIDRVWRDEIRRNLDLPIKDIESLASYVRRGLAQWFRETLEEHVAKAPRHEHTGP